MRSPRASSNLLGDLRLGELQFLAQEIGEIGEKVSQGLRQTRVPQTLMCHEIVLHSPGSAASRDRGSPSCAVECF
jgi:hypothetical protein